VRTKILREPGKVGYPLYVCYRCGKYACDDSMTMMEKYVEWEFNCCGICSTLTEVAHPRDFGWPTFYTYANGAPVRRNT
jgi:hypothetical protein